MPALFPPCPGLFPSCAGPHRFPSVTTNGVLETNAASPAATPPAYSDYPLYQGNAQIYGRNPYDTTKPGAYITSPEAWARFVSVIDDEDRGDILLAYAKIFNARPGTHEYSRQDEAVLAWSAWEGLISNLSIRPDDLGKFADLVFAKALVRLENHYFLNGGFLGGPGDRDQNYIIENAWRLVHIPMHIVQGRYDQVCPRFQSDELVYALQSVAARIGVPLNIDYRITPAGHSWSERENAIALTQVMDELSR